jgi:hypothetical protein
MKSFTLAILFSIISITPSVAQLVREQVIGNVSFLSTEHVYVRFVSTDGISIGDTLYFVKENTTIPLLIVKSLSSISCVCVRLDNTQLNIRNTVFALKTAQTPNIEMDVEKSKQGLSPTDQVINEVKKDTIKKDFIAQTDGRLSVTSYSNLSTQQTNDNQRFRYNLNLNAQHIGNSRFSFDTYVSFTHQLPLYGANLNDTSKIFERLKIYSLNAKFDFTKTANISIGRRINPNMANIGAIDGIQIENTSGQLSYGALIGFRPNYTNYWINDSLLDFGGFIGHKYFKEDSYVNTSIAFFNQTNHGYTDRRYAYIQHSNSILKNLDFFGSMELDIFKLENGKPTNTLDITSTYLSLRYRPWRQVNLSLAYDARKNVYYFQTYKNMAQTLLDVATRQGMRFQCAINPINNLTWGGNVGYRLPSITNGESANAYTHLTYSNLPFIEGAMSVSATGLKTPMLNGNILGASYSRDVVEGKLFAMLEYQKVNYQFTNGADPLLQDIGELSLSWFITRKLLLSASYELTIDSENKQTRVFINLSQRF